MKSFLYFFTLFLFSNLVFSQNTGITKNDKVVYLDSLEINVTNDNYKYIRVIKDFYIDKKESYQVKEYYRSGKIAMIGSIKSNSDYVKTGSFLSYYENGNRKAIENYKDGKLFGEYFKFYENGDKMLVAVKVEDDVKEDSIEKINQFWDRNGIQKVIDGNGFYELKDNKESEKGELKNGFKEGIWEGSQASFSYKETYKKGKLISGLGVDESLNSYPYTIIEVLPVPKKGIENFYNFVGVNYRVPESVGMNGKIVLAFVVDKSGVIVDPKIITDLGFETGEEALRVLKLFGNWIPGEVRGRKENFTYVLPISIQSSN